MMVSGVVDKEETSRYSCFVKDSTTLQNEEMFRYSLSREPKATTWKPLSSMLRTDRCHRR